MAYDNFTEQKVFKSNNVNVFCNRIYDALINEYDEETVEEAFCITGTVAKIIQGDPLSEIKVIAFITNDKQIFKYCGHQLPKVLDASAVRLTDRVQMTHKGIFYEFHFIDNVGTIDTINTLQVQDTEDIPSNIN